MVLFFKLFGAGDFVDKDGGSDQISDLLCCKCLLKLLKEYRLYVLLWVRWLPRELKWLLLMFLLCVNVGHVLFFVLQLNRTRGLVMSKSMTRKKGKVRWKYHGYQNCFIVIS